MFSYYGSKSIIVDLYPPPKYGKVKEPFAGSARYALKYWDREVVLYDKFDKIIEAWHYLQQASEKDVQGLPEIRKGMDLRTMSLSSGEKTFLGFLFGISSTAPRNKPSPFACEQNGRKNKYQRVAAELHKIRHWKVIQGSYEDIPNEEATWFIDPPYEKAGYAYKHSNINYEHLAHWSKERIGQSIVCENTGATWLPFEPLAMMRGGNGKKAEEAMWTNIIPEPRLVQYDLFGNIHRMK